MSNKKFSFGLSEAPKDFGTPSDLDPSEVYQKYPDTCAIRCQELILKDFGIDISQEDLIQQAINQGWYEPGQGTSPLDVGNLLELHGLQVNRYENGNIFSLVNELAQGHKVIVGVDADELWNKGFDWKDWLGFDSPNHALLVSNIDTTDPNNITVTLTDPGTGDVAKTYSFEQFEDAWKDSNCFVCATQDPPPLKSADYMINFDYITGHLDDVLNGLPFEVFHTHFESMFNMDVASATFKDTLVNTLNNHDLKAWVSNGAGMIADWVLPGSGIPVRELVRFSMDMIPPLSSTSTGLGADSNFIRIDPSDLDSHNASHTNSSPYIVDAALDNNDRVCDDPGQGLDASQDMPDIPMDAGD